MSGCVRTSLILFVSQADGAHAGEESLLAEGKWEQNWHLTITRRTRRT